MIGKGLRDRYELSLLESDRAKALVEQALTTLGKEIVRVRAEDPRLVACVVVHADEATVRLCKKLGLRMKPAGSAVFGLQGGDVGALLGKAAEAHTAWLSAPSGARESKVVLLAGGIAFASVTIEDGKVDVRVR